RRRGRAGERRGWGPPFECRTGALPPDWPVRAAPSALWWCRTRESHVIHWGCWAARRAARDGSMDSSRRYVLISPCRDEAKHMRRTLESVAAQTVPPASWVVVDDGSTDATPEILREYAG